MTLGFLPESQMHYNIHSIWLQLCRQAKPRSSPFSFAFLKGTLASNTDKTTDYGPPISYIRRYSKLLGLGRQIGQINFGAFGVFSADYFYKNISF